VAVAEGGLRREVREYGRIANTATALDRLVRKLGGEGVRLRAEGKMLAGGLPVGDRAFACIIEAASNDEADRIVRDMPAWGLLEWEVTPLQSVEARAEMERKILQPLKSARRRSPQAQARQGKRKGRPEAPLSASPRRPLRSCGLKIGLSWRGRGSRS